jgi:hypothetical protein
MPNQVKLTFAGDESNLVGSFDRTGGAAERMSDRVGESGSGFDRAGEAADGAEGKAQGFSDTLTGVADIGAGTSEIMKGNLFEGFVTLGTGAADLAGGLAEFLIPALAKTRIGTLASAAASKVSAAASKSWAAAQWIMNSALWASPITWVVAGVLLLIGVIVLIATKTDWFSRAWRASWAWIQRAASNTWDWLKKLPGWIGGAFSKIGNSISAPFKSAFNAIARAWNNTVGRLSWTVPGWVPIIGGNSISVPNLPTFHAGGIVPGVPGTPTMALLQAGERVSSVASSGGSDGEWVSIRGDGILDPLIEAIAARVGARGGRPAQLGIRVG